jgi:hypothetical protein
MSFQEYRQENSKTAQWGSKCAPQTIVRAASGSSLGGGAWFKSKPVLKLLYCAFFGGAFVLVSCSSNHTLTPRTAKAMIVKANDTTPLHYSATYGEIERIVAEPTVEDYTQGQYAPGSSKEKVKELIAAGYVAITRTEAKNVPTVSGEYSGTFGPSGETWLLTTNLSNVPNTDTVTGSFSQVLQRGIHCRADGSVSGVVENDGEATLHFEASRGEGGHVYRLEL